MASIEENENAVSLVDLVKQDLAELSSNVDCYIPVAGYKASGLAVRYRLPENGKVLDDIATKVMRVDNDKFYRNLHIAMDTMILLCAGLYVKPVGVDDWVMLDPDDVGEPVKFDHRLAPIIGLPDATPTARIVLRKLFDGNDQALLTHSEKLSRWLTDTSADLTMELWQLGG